MAVLSDGLQWILSANNKDLNKKVDESKGKVKELDKQTEKSTASMGKGFKDVTQTVSKVRSAIALYGAALGALVAPMLRVDSATTKLATASRLAGEKIGKNGLVAAAKDAANAMGSNFSTAATSAAETMNRFGVSSDAALKLVAAGWKTAKLGIATETESIGALVGVAKAYHQNIGDVAQTLSTEMNAAAKLTGASLGEVGGALQNLAPLATQANVSTRDLLTTMVALDKQGVPLQQSQAMIATALQAAIDPTDAQREALDKLGLLGYSALTSIGGSNFIPFMQTATGAIGTQKEAVTSLLGNVTGLNAQYAGSAASTFLAASDAITKSVADQEAAMKGSISAVDVLTISFQKLVDAIGIGLNGALEKTLGLLQSAGEAVGNWLADLAQATGTFGFNAGGEVPSGFASGGSVPGNGSGDTVPAMLTPGEFVVKKSVASKLRPQLHALNSGRVGGYALGGFASYYGGSTMSRYTMFQSANPMIRAMAMFGGIPGGGGSGFLGRGSGFLGSGSPLLGAFGNMLGYAGRRMFYGGGYSRFGFADGGEVPNFSKARRYANGGDVAGGTSHVSQGAPVGSSSNYSIQNANFNFPNAKVSPTTMRDTIVPAWSRETKAGRNPRARTRL